MLKAGYMLVTMSSVYKNTTLQMLLHMQRYKLCYNYITRTGRRVLIFFVLQLFVLVAFSALLEPFCQLLLHVPSWLRV